MNSFLLKTILRAVSVLCSLLLLKFALDGFIAYNEPWIRVIYIVIIVLGIPLIFLLMNVVANLIKYNNDNNGGKK